MRRVNVSAIDAVLRDAAERQDVPGVVALAASSRRIIYAGAFGQRDVDGHAPMTLDTIGYIASMTKAITATAAMQLVERGRLKLDAPAADILPELGKTQVLTGFSPDGTPMLRLPRRAITLRSLLTHTSGFAYEIWNDTIIKYATATRTPSIFTSENAALAVPLVAEPGDRWVYGIGIDWVGKMVEAVTNQSLGDYLADNIFTPLCMADTSFGISSEQRERVASIHDRGTDGSLKSIPWEFNQSPEFQQGGGGLYGTMLDYLRFTQMLLRRGVLDDYHILGAATVEAMAQNHIGELDVQPLITAMPRYSNDVNFFPGIRQKWGLSFLINSKTSPEGRSKGSIGWAGLTNCFFWVDFRKDVTGVFMTQVFPFFDEPALAVFRAFEGAIYASIGT